ncbi:hypothetical protein FO519_003012 [Halicephalobus sp. NKZ332]|nr:hypothetical protein FO519_003012 [Halicephalobus sp. NKZ332]
MSGFRPSIPSEYLELLSSSKYSGLPDFRVRGGQVYFLAQVAQTGAVELWRTRSGEDASKISPDGISIGSRLNCYGASALAPTHGGDDIFCLSGKELLKFNKNGTQDVYQLPEVEKYTYGDPVVAQNYLYMVRDAEGNQEVVRWSFEDLDKKVEPRIVEKPGFFYGNLSVNPSETKILFNSWNNGLPFERADVLIHKVDTADSENILFTHPFGPAKYPCWLNDEDFMYISDSTGYDRIYGRSLVDQSWIKLEGIYEGSEDIGDPNWLVGQQSPVVASPEHIVFIDSKHVYIHFLKTSETKSVELFNATLVRMDPENPNFVYFKCSGTKSISIKVINLHSPKLSIETVFEINFIQENSKVDICTPEWKMLNHIPGIVLSPSKDITPRPTIIWLHGGPTMRLPLGFDLRRQMFVAAGFNVVVPAFSGTAGFGRDLRRKLYGQWGIADAQDICDIVPFLTSNGYSLPGKIYLIGSSAGAYLALCSIARSQGNIFAGASITASFYDVKAVVDESIPFELACSQHLMPPYEWDILGGLLKKKVPIAFFHGSDDPVVSSSAPAELSRKLSQEGIRTLFKEYEGEGHGIKKSDNVLDWINSTMNFFSDA